MPAPSTPSASALVTLDGVSLRTPDGRLLFENLTQAFGRERTGLVGRNGTGKTSLLRLITGEAAPAAGAVSVRARLGVLRQDLAAAPGGSVAGLLGADEDLARLRRIEDGRADDHDLAEADWGLEARLHAALQSVGLGGLDPQAPVGRLSGGEVTRAALAGLLAAEPDLLILDEPTNNLDAQARDLVADALCAWRGGAIVVSHDRRLLRRMDRILELSSLGACLYGGGWDAYETRKGAETAAAARGLADAERAAARAGREAQAARERQDRRDAAGRRFRDRSSDPKILLDFRAERAERTAGRGGSLAARAREQTERDLAEARAAVERGREFSFDLPSTGLAPGKTVLAFEAVSFGHEGASPLIRNLTDRLIGPERVAVTGPNDAGKTTLLRLALGDLRPTRGEVRLTARAALMDQHAALLGAEEALAQTFRRLNPTASDQAARAALARFGFRNVAADKPAAALSGGERLRAALACVLMAPEPPQLLVLDEPTNHLDLDSVAALEAALSDYDGALLVVSHDADFLRAIGVEREIRLGAG